MKSSSCLFLATAVATARQTPESYDEHHLKGTNTEANEDRDLLTIWVRARQVFPFRLLQLPRQINSVLTTTRSVWNLEILLRRPMLTRDTSGNAFAIAYSEEYLWLESICEPYAYAYSQVCAFTKVDGQIDVGC
jgi:hypothetical protein